MAKGNKKTSKFLKALVNELKASVAMSDLKFTHKFKRLVSFFNFKKTKPHNDT